jgi:hypothetical protein
MLGFWPSDSCEKIWGLPMRRVTSRAWQDRTKKLAIASILLRLRVAEALEQLPELAKALRQGVASWSCVRELSRVATHEPERAWLQVARGRTVREVERRVSGHRRGSLPSDATCPDAEQHVLRFAVSGEVLATFREAMAQIRRAAGGPLDDDTALLLMARHVLGGPSDEGRASYQVELTVCAECQRGKQGRGAPGSGVSMSYWASRP